MTNPVIEWFEECVRDHEMIGTFDVQDRPLIEAEYKKSKNQLTELLKMQINARVMPPVIIPKPLTAEQLADAFEAFNNEALTHDIGCIAAGFMAIARQLRSE